ncbi:MAG: DNA repair protein RadC [Clostridia bacterium]|nr:DNA repair protein RadC [Clostridia bacterium]
MNMNHAIKELPESERPYERFLDKGALALSDAELLAIMIRTGVKGESALDLSRRLLNISTEGLIILQRLSIEELQNIQGIGQVKAIQLKCIAELSNRLARACSEKKVCFDTPSTVAQYYMEDYRHLETEHCLLILLNAKNHLIGDFLLSKGTVMSTLVSTREIFKKALQCGAVFFMLLHNHPSGDSSPSRGDILMTKKLFDAGNIMDVKLIDHIIIGDNSYSSMKELQLF